MKQQPRLLYYFRKYPLFRFSLLVSLLLIAGILTFLIPYLTKPIPVIDSITPAICSGGETLTIRGSGFGSFQTDSYVELSGNRITTSSYSAWSDTEIRLILPYNVDDGLLFVITPYGHSQPVVFTNRESLPIGIRPDTERFMPVAIELSVEKAEIGEVVNIQGRNFGALRGKSQVRFTASTDEPPRTPATSTGANTGTEDEEPEYGDVPTIPCSEFDHDYLSWTDYEISVRVPDGAATGFLYVETEHGGSNRLPIEITAATGAKAYSDPHTYRVSTSMDMSGVSGKGSVFVFMPTPATCAWQRDKAETQALPEPILKQYSGTVLHQIKPDGSSESEEPESVAICDTFEITVHETNVAFKNRTPPAGKAGATYYPQYIKPDAVVPSDAKEITDLVGAIIKRERSPYQQAILSYNWLLGNITILQELRPAWYDVLDALQTKYGDAYDFAILYTALLRAAGIPAIPVAGVVVDADMVVHNHWWAEFYIDNVGWIPVDPAMGAGLQISIFEPKERPQNYYFGSIDSSHIALSRGLNNIKNSQTSGKKVCRPKTYALQSMWEEASHDAILYKSFWKPVAVDLLR